MSEYLGRPLEKDEVVHHCNENRKDNRIENLELELDFSHKRIHSTTGRTMVTLICGYCSKEFQREKRQIHKKQKTYFCNRNCYKASVAQ